jgi:hypothetical protein
VGELLELVFDLVDAFGGRACLVKFRVLWRAVEDVLNIPMGTSLGAVVVFIVSY